MAYFYLLINRYLHIKGVITVLLILAGIILYGQDLTFRQADSISFSLYNKQNWDSLALLTKKFNHKELNYYQLNLRLGIAYFNLKQYNQSEYYLKKAVKNNSQSETPKDYLFGIYINQGNEMKASEMYRQLSSEKQKSYTYKPKQLLTYFYGEGGSKFPNNQQFAPIGYFSLMASHKPLWNYKISENVSFVFQNNPADSFRQQQYCVVQQVYFGKGNSLKVGANFSRLKSSFNKSHLSVKDTTTFLFMTRYDIHTSYTYLTKGEFKQNVLLFNGSFEKDFRKLIFNIGLTCMIENQLPDFFEKYETKIDTNKILNGNIVQSTENVYFDSIPQLTPLKILHFQPELSIDYKIGKQINLGLDIIGFSNKDTNTIHLQPRLTMGLGRKFWLTASYFQNVFHPISFYNGLLVFTGYNKINQKVSLVGNMRLNKNVSLIIVYQHENIDDIILNTNYIYNTAIVGIKLHL